MMISSTVVALNFQRNFEQITNAKNYLIFMIDETIEIADICKIEQYFIEKKLGKVLPIFYEKESSAFSIVFSDVKDLEKLSKILKRLLWESGVLLSSKIVQMSPVMKVLKEYGQGE